MLCSNAFNCHSYATSDSSFSACQSFSSTIATTSSSASSTLVSHDEITWLQNAEYSRIRPPLADWKYIKDLGDGASSQVFLVMPPTTTNTNGPKLALKVIPKSSNGLANAIRREKNIHVLLSKTMRDWVVPLKAASHDGNNFYLAMDYYAGGDLAHEIIRCGSFSQRRAQFYAAEMVLMLTNLHNNRIIHRDFKPANILIREDGHLTLADFGLSHSFNIHRRSKFGCADDNDPTPCTTSEYVGTPYFMSPEQHRGVDYSFDADWWALGVMLYLMLTGRLPFAANASTPAEIAFSVALEPVQFDKSDSQIDEHSKSLIRGLLVKDRRKRLCDPKAIMSHPFFHGVNWINVAQRTTTPQHIPFIVPTSSSRRPSHLTTLSQTSKIAIGEEYPPSIDPYPDLTWTSPDFLEITSSSVPLPYVQTWKKAIRSMANLVRVGEKQR